MAKASRRTSSKKASTKRGSKRGSKIVEEVPQEEKGSRRTRGRMKPQKKPANKIVQIAIILFGIAAICVGLWAATYDPEKPMRDGKKILDELEETLTSLDSAYDRLETKRIIELHDEIRKTTKKTRFYATKELPAKPSPLYAGDKARERAIKMLARADMIERELKAIEKEKDIKDIASDLKIRLQNPNYEFDLDSLLSDIDYLKKERMEAFLGEEDAAKVQPQKILPKPKAIEEGKPAAVTNLLGGSKKKETPKAAPVAKVADSGPTENLVTSLMNKIKNKKIARCRIYLAKLAGAEDLIEEEKKRRETGPTTPDFGKEVNMDGLAARAGRKALVTIESYIGTGEKKGSFIKDRKFTAALNHIAKEQKKNFGKLNLKTEWEGVIAETKKSWKEEIDKLQKEFDNAAKPGITAKTRKSRFSKLKTNIRFAIDNYYLEEIVNEAREMLHKATKKSYEF